MNNSFNLLICVISYIVVLVVLHIFLEKRLNRLYHANTMRVPAEDNIALNTIHSRLKLIVRVLSFLLLVGGIFVLVTLLYHGAHHHTASYHYAKTYHLVYF